MASAAAAPPWQRSDAAGPCCAARIRRQARQGGHVQRWRQRRREQWCRASVPGGRVAVHAIGAAQSPERLVCPHRSCRSQNCTVSLLVSCDSTFRVESPMQSSGERVTKALQPQKGWSSSRAGPWLWIRPPNQARVNRHRSQSDSCRETPKFARLGRLETLPPRFFSCFSALEHAIYALEHVRRLNVLLNTLQLLPAS